MKKYLIILLAITGFTFFFYQTRNANTPKGYPEICEGKADVGHG
jgi:hypothetical protein